MAKESPIHKKTNVSMRFPEDWIYEDAAIRQLRGPG